MPADALEKRPDDEEPGDTTRKERAEGVVKNYVLWGSGAGLVPFPLFDLVAVTALQLNMLQNLAEIYGEDFSKAKGKAFVSALTGSTAARIGTSALKAVPIIGQVFGGLASSVASAASTYAVGHVAIQYLEDEELSFLHIDLDQARASYEEAFERGKEFVTRFTSSEEEVDVNEFMSEEEGDVFDKLSRLGKLRQDGVITEREFEAKKRELLKRI